MSTMSQNSRILSSDETTLLRDARLVSKHEELDQPFKRQRTTSLLSVANEDDDPVLRSYKESAVKGSSWFSAAFVLANVIMGVTLLNFPLAYKQAGGCLPALLLQGFVLVAVIIGMQMLIYCATEGDYQTLQGVVYGYLGSSWLVVTNFFIFTNNYGACITLLVILGDLLDEVIANVYGSTFCHYWYFNRTFTLPVISLVLILPFCCTKRLDAFNFTSYVGVVATLFMVVLVSYKYFHPHYSDVITMSTSPRALEVLKAVPVLVLSFEGNIEVVPLYRCLKKQNLKEFVKVSILGCSICFFVFGFVGSLGYMTLGDTHVLSDLLAAYSPPDVIVKVAMAIMALKSITTFPCILFCARLVVEDTLQWIQSATRIHSTENRRRFYSGVFMFLASLVLALFVPSIGSIIAILGSSGAYFVFIVPGLCFLTTHEVECTNLFRLFLGCTFIAVGVFVLCSTFCHSIMRYMNNEFSKTDIPCTDL